MLKYLHATNLAGFDTLGEALVNAAWRNDYSAVKRLVDQNANPNYETLAGNTPLAGTRHTAIAALLLRHRAIVEAPNKLGYTALIKSTIYGNLPMVELLLANKANVDSEEYQGGATALYFAIIKNHVSIAKVLIEHYANVNHVSTSGMSPLHLAARGKAGMMAELLWNQKANLDFPNPNNGYTALFYAILADSKEIVQNLLEAKANITARDGKGNSIIKFAYQHKRYAMVDLIIRLVPEVELGSVVGLENVFGFGSKEVVGRLAKTQMNLDLCDDCGATALHWAALRGHLDLVAMLLQNKANVDGLDAYQRTPLVLAIGQSHHDIIKHLLNSGAEFGKVSGHYKFLVSTNHTSLEIHHYPRQHYNASSCVFSIQGERWETATKNYIFPNTSMKEIKDHRELLRITLPWFYLLSDLLSRSSVYNHGNLFASWTTLLSYLSAYLDTKILCGRVKDAVEIPSAFQTAFGHLLEADLDFNLLRQTTMRAIEALQFKHSGDTLEFVDIFNRHPNKIFMKAFVQAGGMVKFLVEDLANYSL